MDIWIYGLVHNNVTALKMDIVNDIVNAGAESKQILVYDNSTYLNWMCSDVPR